MLSDFGCYPACDSDERYRVGALGELKSVVRNCFERGKRMRVRCFAHSMNGMSVPSADETLLDLTGIRHVQWRNKGVITAGAGLSIWELDHYVRRFGWKLPVVNDGGAEAPSIGGFLAAGGIGESTLFYGGFWESVRSVTLVTGDGRSRVVGRRGSIFRWLFGSMGTLGIVYEVTLDLVPIGSARPVPVSNVASLRQKRPASWPAHLWLTLFVRERQREQAIERLNRLVVRHPKAWKPRQMYEYHLPHRRFSPPLLFAGRANFVAVGIWGDRIDGSDLTNYLALEADFQMLTEQTGFRRYFQTELIRKDRSLECYVGRTCAANYRSIKKICDPKALLNQMSGRGVS